MRISVQKLHGTHVVPVLDHDLTLEVVPVGVVVILVIMGGADLIVVSAGEAPRPPSIRPPSL